MGISKFDDTFLARWIEGKLSNKELEMFKKSSEYLSYIKILKGTENLFAPDFEQDKVLKKIQKQIAQKPKVFHLNTSWISAIAASIIITLGLYFVHMGKTNYNTKFGQQFAINLPDASLVDLNSNSKLAFNKTTWLMNRVVSLDGEAFFKVEKGSKFTVDTPEGMVTVKGTQFNVYSKSNYFEVSCYQGTVEISHPYKNTIKLITKGQQIRIQPDLIEKRPLIGEQPSWITGESNYDSVPLNIVINALENQYGIVITNNNVKTNQLYTGSFTHKDLRLALKTVFDPMNVGFVIQDKKNIIIKPL